MGSGILLFLLLTTLTTNISILKWREHLIGFTAVGVVVQIPAVEILSANNYIVGNIRPNPPMLRPKAQNLVLL